MGDAKWTKEQELAIKTRHCNLLVAAAAGSGKTAVLVERIIRIITNTDTPIDIDKLLVVTFTNAAAAEMRERIGDAISKALDKNPESRVLQKQLTLLNNASITTMHSFCLQVIRNNFHRIDLDPNFRIADSTEETLLRGETLQELFEEKYAESEDADNGFLTLVESYGGGRDDLKLQEIVMNLYGFVMSGPWPEKWVHEMTGAFNVDETFDFGSSMWGNVLISSIKVEILGIKGVVEKTIVLIKDAKGLEPYLSTLMEDLELINNLYKLCDSSWNNLYEGFINYKFVRIGSLNKKAEYDKELSEKVKNIRDNTIKKKLNKLRDDIFRFSPMEIQESLEKLYPMMKCLGELVLQFDEHYKAKKRERGLLDFGDLEHLALSILTVQDEDGNVTPSETALELRNHFDEVLVDEYQDSNNVQEVIINMVSKKLTDTPNVFMVGDIKQSIYRFRQAEPGLFLDKYENYSIKEGSLDRVITLYKNFRSREEVINGVNYIFKTIMSKAVGELEYTEEEALNLGADFKPLEEDNSIAGGPIEFHIIEKVSSSEEQSFDEEEEVTENEESSEEEEMDDIQLEARVVARRIKELMSDNEGKIFKVYDKTIDKYRPVQYKDIVILMRATKSYAPVFVDELLNQGIPVYADTGTGYFDTIEIRTMMSMLQTIDNPLQDIPLVAVLRSPIFDFTPEELIDIRLGAEKVPFYMALKKYIEDVTEGTNDALKKKVEDFIDTLEMWREKALHIPIDELIWYLFTSTGYYGYAGAMPGGIQRQANLRILFERARQFEQTSYRGLFNFVNFINKLRTSSGDMGSAKVLGENEDVVRIMSIHKSKGLEFPVVILASCGKNFNLMDINKTILFHQDLGIGPDYVDTDRRITYPTIIKLALKRKIKLETLSEEMRILYVAFTRAKEKLIITGTVRNIRATCLKWWSGIETDNEKVPEYTVLNYKTYMDWIGTSVIKHIDGSVLRKYAEVESYNTGKLNEDNSHWNIRMWNKKDITVDSVYQFVDNLQENKISCDYLEKAVDNKPESVYKKEIERRLNWKYSYMEASKIPAKISVTELKRLGNELFSDSYTTNMFTPKLSKKPVFLEEKKGLSAAERGTAVHFVMQHLDLRKISDFNAISDQIKSMVRKELLTDEQAMSVNIKSVQSFFSSPLGRRMLSVKDFDRDIRREIPFYIKLRSTDVYGYLPKENYENEITLLQGVIDCYFIEKDEVVLLDYKTDYVENDNIEEIKKRYEKQIYYYAEALTRITGKKVKEKYIYLFSNGQIIKY
ncbi:ATP-dependent nuclease subunit A [Clostridiales bacterium oral taxon 876 str. F0540]|nr:ATP-dependent nuclease subunit A [Clostridiales bacterium oral taxon 876 str. F0540]